MIMGYDKAFGSQMKESREKSFNYNIPMHIEASSNHGSDLAVILSFSPTLHRGKDKLTAQDVLNDGITI